ncbi:MAG TPA: hypothetical protein VG605_03055 [Puia sp.]|jgi:hypothetical protein|nr:hypothetical protein [Puia sp.]
MKIRTILSVCTFLMAALAGSAQPDTAKISKNALAYADSLVKADAFGNWSSYADLAPASVIKYYGGKDGFITHVSVCRLKTTSEIQEAAPELRLITLETRKEQWQCEIRLSRYFHKEDKQFHLITYLIGQSLDEGETWKYFDVSYNSVANIIYMFPDIMDDIAINEPAVLSQEQEDKLAHNK